MPVAISYILQ